MQLIISLLLLLSTLNCQLATIDTLNDLGPTTSKLTVSAVGLNFNFTTAFPTILNSTLFQAYLLNSRVYGNTLNTWRIFLSDQTPVGIKYNCTAYAQYLTNFTCSTDLSLEANANILLNFARNIIQTGASLHLGMDLEGLDPTNPLFLLNLQIFQINYYSPFRKIVNVNL